MNADFFEALKLLAKEKKIPLEYLVEKIRNGIVIAMRRDGEGDEDIVVEIDPVTNRFYVANRKRAVEAVTDPNTEILIDLAKQYDAKVVVGGKVEIPRDPQKFGRIAAQSAKNILRQGIRDRERDQLLAEYQGKQHDIVTGTVTRSDDYRGNVTIEVGNSEAVLIKNEQIPGETFRQGDKLKVYIVDVTSSERAIKLLISRTHPGLVKRLFEMQVPEIYDGTVEVKSISREAGSRTKIAVWSRDPDVDPQGACIGPKGVRVSEIVEELNGEKIDVIKWSEDPAEFVAEALSPAKVTGVEILDEVAQICRVTVPDDQLSLAIGNKGQNARLAARLTGWKIDIRPESGIMTEAPSKQETKEETEEL